MTTTTNEAERRRWNDAAWAAVWPKRERFTDAVTPHLLAAAALQPGERVLDIGSGGGKTSIVAAAAVAAGGSVVGADVSVPLTALAQERAAEAGVTNATFAVVDVQVDEIAGAPFDAAISQFGVMFFDEPETAFANVHRQMAPGGRLVFACWQTLEQNPWFFVPAIASFVPEPPPLAPGKSRTGPFALADAERTTALLEGAGFRDVERETHEFGVDVAEDAVVDEAQLVFMGIPPERMTEAAAAVDGYMKQFRTDEGLSRFPLAFQIFRATA